MIAGCAYGAAGVMRDVNAGVGCAGVCAEWPLKAETPITGVAETGVPYAGVGEATSKSSAITGENSSNEDAGPDGVSASIAVSSSACS